MTNLCNEEFLYTSAKSMLISASLDVDVTSNIHVAGL